MKFHIGYRDHPEHCMQITKRQAKTSFATSSFVKSIQIEIAYFEDLKKSTKFHRGSPKNHQDRPQPRMLITITNPPNKNQSHHIFR